MISRKTRIFSTAIVAVAAVALTIWPASGKTETVSLQPDDAATVARGKQVYAADCASCHGDNLQGQPDWKSPGPDGRMPAPPHDRSGHTWHHADQVLFELTKYGLQKFAGDDYQSNMPSYQGTLIDDDIVAVLSFIKSTWPAEIKAHHDRINAAAAANKSQ